MLSGFVTVRNKAFHAEWEKIDRSDVSSIIGFVREFLGSWFSTPPSAQTPPASQEEARDET